MLLLLSCHATLIFLSAESRLRCFHFSPAELFAITSILMPAITPRQCRYAATMPRRHAAHCAIDAACYAAITMIFSALFTDAERYDAIDITLRYALLILFRFLSCYAIYYATFTTLRYAIIADAMLMLRRHAATYAAMMMPLIYFALMMLRQTLRLSSLR